MKPHVPDPPRPSGRKADLEGAIREASDHLGVSHEDPAQSLPPSDPSGQTLWIRVAIGSVALAVLLGGTLLVERRVPGLEAHRVEADLRWAVSEVVEEVERLHGMRGALPGPEELQGLLSEATDYIPEGDTYRVVGARNGVRVEFDGRIPLDEWRVLVLYPPDSR